MNRNYIIFAFIAIIFLIFISLIFIDIPSPSKIVNESYKLTLE